MKTLGMMLLSGLLIGLPHPSMGQQFNPEKKLLQWGWDNPTPKYIRENITQMQRMPFDGIVIKIPVEAPADEWLSKSIFRNVPVPYEMIEDDLLALKSTQFGKLTDNFTVINLHPGEVDWFDDFSAVFHNIKLATRIAKEGGLKGFAFDLEMYSHAIYFTYPYQKYINTKSYDEYCRQVEKRGAQLMQVINAIYPDITIFITAGYSQDLTELEEEGPLKTNEHGLRHAFLNGMVKGASDQTTLIDGYEASYGYTTEQQFLQGYHRAIGKARVVCPYKRKFAQVWRVGFGIMLDAGAARRGWHTDDFTKNFRAPDELERDLAYALQTSDKYVWLYNEIPKFWPSRDLPGAYVDAIRRARAKGNIFADLSKRHKRKIYHASPLSPRDEKETFGKLWEKYEDLGNLPNVWHFRPDPEVMGYRQKWHESGQPLGEWKEINVPDFWEPQGWPDFDGVGWYRTTLHVPAKYQGKKIALAFGAVDEAARVFLNGQEAGSYVLGARKGRNKPFTIDITKFVKFDHQNLLVVEVFDTRHMGGIWKPVKLVAHKEKRSP